jgi:hypothetical protein
MGKPWIAYSWLFELIVFGLYQRLGYLGLILYVYFAAILITVFVHRLVKRVEPRLAYSIGLTAVALFAMAPVLQPRPWLLTILFFIVEFDLLLAVRKSRNYRQLYLLLPVFVLWTNIHVQFVYGLFLLGLATLEQPVIQLLKKSHPDLDDSYALPPRLMSLITAACMIATLVSPYHIKIYAVLLDIFRQAGLYDPLSELKSMEFRTMPDFFALMLTLVAAYSLGRSRNIKVFWIVLFVVSTILSFRSRRDVWFATTIAVVMIPLMFSTIRTSQTYVLSAVQKLIIITAVVVLLFPTARASHAREDELQLAVANTFPVDAANFVEQQGYSGPIYNYYDWGGYLMWRFPNLLVSIDGRNQVHDMDRLRHYMGIWNGAPGWASDPELSSARLVIAEKVLPLSQLLRLDPRFKLVYEDELATVFVSQTP